MPLDSVVVSAWLSDVQTAEHHASLRKRPLAELDPAPRLPPRKQRALVETLGNIHGEVESPSKNSRSSTRRRSPRKPADAPKDATERIRRGRPTSRDAALDNFAHPILSPSSSSQYTIAISANTASADGASWDVVSAGKKSKNTGRRPPSPTKTVSDTEMLDKPIRYCVRDEDEHSLPPELSSHWEVLETLCNNVGIIPASIEACCWPLNHSSYQADLVPTG